MTRKALNDLTNSFNGLTLNNSTNVKKANMPVSPIRKEGTSVARGASEKANLLAALDKLNASAKNLKTKKETAIRNAKHLLALGKKKEASMVYKQIKLLDEQLSHVKHTHDTYKRQIDVIAGRQQRHSPPAPTLPSRHSPSMPKHSPPAPTFPSPALQV